MKSSVHTDPSISDIVQMRAWKHALFTTYTLSLSYFESEILRPLLRAGCSDIWLIADAEGYRSSLLERRSMRVGQEPNSRIVDHTCGRLRASAFAADRARQPTPRSFRDPRRTGCGSWPRGSRANGRASDCRRDSPQTVPQPEHREHRRRRSEYRVSVDISRAPFPRSPHSIVPRGRPTRPGSGLWRGARREPVAQSEYGRSYSEFLPYEDMVKLSLFLIILPFTQCVGS